MNNELQLMEATIVLWLREYITNVEKERILKELQKDYEKATKGDVIENK